MIDSRAFVERVPDRNGTRDIIRVLKRRKIIIFAPVVLGAGIAWTIASTTVPRFTATSALTLNVSKVQVVDREVVSRLPLESSTLSGGSYASPATFRGVRDAARRGAAGL